MEAETQRIENTGRPVGRREGLRGAVAGGFAWIALLGIATHSVWLVVGALAAVAIGWFLRRPGAVVAWIALGNLAVVNLCYDDIPERAFGISTGKSMLPLWVLNVCLAGLLVLGVVLLRVRPGTGK